MRNEKKKGSGCLKIFLISLVLVFIFLCGAGFLIYKNAGSIGRNFSAQAIESFGEQVIEESNLPLEEKEKLKEPFSLFAKDVRDGKVSMEDGVKIIEEISDGPIWSLVMIQSFVLPKIAISELSEEQKKNSELQFRRLGEGVRRGIISKTVLHETLGEVFPEINIDRNEDVDLARTISSEELISLSKRVKDLVDSANIENKNFDLDLVSQLSKIIKSKMEHNTSE